MGTPKYTNTSTVIPASQAEIKLPAHIAKMNQDGWEILSVTMSNEGLNSNFVIFWKKLREE